MDAVSIYRSLLLLRGSWLLLEWIFNWGSHSRVDSFTLLHPFAFPRRECSRRRYATCHSCRPVVLPPLGTIAVCSRSRVRRYLQRAPATTLLFGTPRSLWQRTCVFSWLLARSLRCLFSHLSVICLLPNRPNVKESNAATRGHLEDFTRAAPGERETRSAVAVIVNDGAAGAQTVALKAYA